MGYKLIVVTNQSGVARGIITERVLNEIHQRLKQLLERRGVKLDAIYHCPYHPEGSVPKYRRESDLRKPSPGMLLLAAKKMDIDLSRSWMIGNSHRDVIAGGRAGCKTILLDTPGATRDALDYSEEQSSSTPDYKAVNMKEAVNIIRRYEGLLKQPSLTPTPEPTSKTEQTPPDVKENDQPMEQDSSEVTTEVTSQSQQIQPEANQDQTSPAHHEQTEAMLREIIVLLKGIQRHGMFSEFSATKLLAGVLQVVAGFCLLMSLGLFLRESKAQASPALITLGFAAVLQLMALTFYLMRDRK
jgi:D-glycero-D-manno-heptose 1,7-bisphosphate phosphatase